MLTSNLVPCFVQSFKTDSKTGYEKALLVGVFDKTTTDLDCCISSSSRDTGKTRQPVAVVMQEDGRLRSYGVVTAILNHMPSAMKYRRRFSVKNTPSATLMCRAEKSPT